ncbi:zinc finger-containing protein [Dendryphion nanum]|uniref:Zinc finger-containing protein n=1 Tax=Dendryphion nanum TaxID=256645 RepID=A0A9P9DF51_9PLEO|nr:zinc finger-containing protein [Dendryphion nanum]
MSHSKRNTSLAFFTSHERASLKNTWGSQSSRLTSDSFLPFGSCQLCLLLAVDPVACPAGDLFCRECAMTNLLAQRKEMKRLEKAAARAADDEEDLRAREDEEARTRAVRDFEAVQMGLEVTLGEHKGGREIAEQQKEEEEDAPDTTSPTSTSPKGTKRKFVLSPSDLHATALSDLHRTKRILTSERAAAKPQLPSFWAPSQTPESNHIRTKEAKRAPVCPSSDPAKPHVIALKTLTSVRFTMEKGAEGGKGKEGKEIATCPSCRKALSNATKAMLAIPCGHVLCKPCVDKFLKPELRHARHAHEGGPEPEVIACFVCDEELVVGGGTKKDKKGIKSGLVEIRSEGTGFAGGGKNMVKREGVAFSI